MATAPDGNTWPKISVITPSFNQGEYLEETIRSVLLQVYPNLEYIVMDGGSSDNSVNILRKYDEHIAHWESKPDRGQSHAINRGFQLASGEVIGWLNSDDVLLPGTLFRVAEALLIQSDVAVAHGTVNYVDALGRIDFVAPRRKQPFRIDNALDGSIYQPGTFWRSSITEEIGLLNETLHYVMDYEYWMRMLLSGADFYCLDGPPLANFRVTDSSKTGKDQDGFGFETRTLIDWYVTQPAVRANAGNRTIRAKRREMKARAGADLRIARGLAHTERGRAFVWLARSVCVYPPFLWTRRKELRRMCRELCR